MTYPPQGPYGQQPPSGQQPYGGPPPQGGYQYGGPQQGGYQQSGPQQPGPQQGGPQQPGPQQGGYQQGGYQQGGYQQGGQPPGYQQGGYPQQQPYGYDPTRQFGQSPYGAGPTGDSGKSSRTGLIAGIAVAVLVIGGLLFTGFVAPGFLTSDRRADPRTPTVKSNVQPTGGNGPEISTQQTLPTDVPTTSGGGLGGGPDAAGFLAFAQSAVNALNTRDFDKIIDLTCDKPSPKEAAEQKKALANQSPHATITGTPKITGNKGTVDIQFQVSGHSEKSNLDGTYRDGAWCGGEPDEGSGSGSTASAVPHN